MGWPGKVILVAGVGNGLGSALVSLLGSAGATMIGVARTAESLDRLTRVAKTEGWKFEGIRADLGVRSEAEAALSSIVDHHGHLDGASLNIGRWVEGDPLLHRTTDEEWATGIRLNLEAVFQAARATIPRLIERPGGSLVLVSACDRVRWAGNASYCAGKGAVADLTHKLAYDYRPFGLRVNAVLPGTMEHELDPAQPPSQGSPLPLRDHSGVGAWEVARAIRHLLSDESRWTTGSLLTVDGGYTTHGKEPPAPGTI